MARQVVEAPVEGERRLRMTYDDWLTEFDENVRTEWVDGEAIVFVPPTVAHQRVVGFLSVLLAWYARAHALGAVLVGPVEMRLSARVSREPDVLFVAREHAGRVTDERVEGPADLVVEIVSEGSVARDRREKRAEYEAVGVREYWIVDSRPGRKEAEFYQRSAAGAFVLVPPDADGRYRSAVLLGFWLRPDWLWREPLPDPVMLLPTIAPEAWRAALARAEAE